MPRPRINDPADTTGPPRFASDPERARELVAEFRRRLRYVDEHHRWMRAAFGPPGSYNASLRRLARAVRPGRRRGPERRLHPFVEMVIGTRARGHARSRSPATRIEQRDVDRAAVETLAALKPKRGAAVDPVLVHHVEGLMALIQESAGVSVLVQRYREQAYDPHPANWCGQMLVALVRLAEPDTRMHRIVDLVLAARKRQAGRPMRFRDYYPLYGAVLDADTGLPIGGIGGRVEAVAWLPPIYCP